ncbi:MAG: iron-sulfur cluster assembly protein [Opitutaceae bacterium]|jgi:metal-sulfur cluster biosynthetic enzyme|nr:iron-sulfur cluster assembly protein [Opitutaceae bacterium]
MSKEQDRNLTRDIIATQIPSGEKQLLAAGTRIHLHQTLGGSHTVQTGSGLYRIDGRDGDALGEPAGDDTVRAATLEDGTPDPGAIWEQLKKVYDPEIPVNIVDLGLVYSMDIEKLPPAAAGDAAAGATNTAAAPAADAAAPPVAAGPAPATGANAAAPADAADAAAGDAAAAPMPGRNPQSPIPNPQFPPAPACKVNVTITLTAPGCGMGPAIAGDVREKVLLVPGVREADVRITWEPPWNQSMISEEGRMQLGLI